MMARAVGNKTRYPDDTCQVVTLTESSPSPHSSLELVVSVPDISFLRLNLSIDCVDVELSCFWRWLSWAYVCSIALSESEEDNACACRANPNDNQQTL